jgi:hypothetical protein
VFAPFVLLAFYSKLSSLAGGCGTLLPFEWLLELVRLGLSMQNLVKQNLHLIMDFSS